MSRWALGVGALACTWTVGCGGDSATVPPADDGGGGGGDVINMPTPPTVGFVGPDGEPALGARYGELFTVRAEGLPPGATATLCSELWGYRGWASYAVDDGGVIDTRTAEAIDGTYTGVHPEGLLWSMVEIADAPEADFDVTVRVELDGVEQHRATFQRFGLDSGLTWEPVAHDGLVAEVFRPADASEPLPAVLVIGGSEGSIGSAQFGAARVAGFGYAAMALAYFAEPGLPADLAEIPLEYFGEALATLAARPDVDPSRIAVMGGSRGGEAALMIGARFPEVKAVVATVPSGYRWASVYDVSVAAWSLMGAPLPFVPSSPNAQPGVETLPDGTTAYRTTPTFLTDIADATLEQLQDATIATEQIGGPVLMLAGADDGIWPSCAMAQHAMERLESSGHDATYDDALHCYDEAGHVGPSPGWPTADTYAYELGPYTLVSGGTPRGNHDAMRAGYEAVKSFLARAL